MHELFQNYAAMHFKWGIGLSLPLAMFILWHLWKVSTARLLLHLIPVATWVWMVSMMRLCQLCPHCPPTLTHGLMDSWMTWRISHIYLGSKPKQNAFLQLLLDRSFSPAPVCDYWAHQKWAVQCRDLIFSLRSTSNHVIVLRLLVTAICWGIGPEVQAYTMGEHGYLRWSKTQSSPQKASDSDPSSLPRNILFATILPILQKFLLPWSNGTLQDWCRDWSLPGGWTESKTVQRRQIYIIWKQLVRRYRNQKFINIDENGNTEENLLLWYRLALSGDSVIAYEHAKVWWKYSWNLPEKAPVISIHHLQAHRAWNLQFRTMMNGTKENACWQGLALRLKHWDIDLGSL